MQPLTLDHQALSHDLPDYNFGMGDASKHTRSQAAQAAQTRPYAILNPFNNQLDEATRALSTINCKPQWNCITHRRNQEHGCGQSNANRNPQSSNPMEQRSQISLPIDRVLNFAWAMCRGAFDRKPCKPHPSHKPGSPHRRRDAGRQKKYKAWRGPETSTLDGASRRCCASMAGKSEWNRVGHHSIQKNGCSRFARQSQLDHGGRGRARATPVAQTWFPTSTLSPLRAENHKGPVRFLTFNSQLDNASRLRSASTACKSEWAWGSTSAHCLLLIRFPIFCIRYFLHFPTLRFSTFFTSLLSSCPYFLRFPLLHFSTSLLSYRFCFLRFTTFSTFVSV